MYVVRGSWVGQTFALATSNDSGGKKSRIRRSKEERKAMVESFIKRYQGSNEGNFPSLNLTHKEVGGSFYTVREIVREIIQENKVLGPARYSSDVEEDDTIAEDYPLGSISREPQGLLFQKEDEIYVVSNHQEKENVERTLDVNGHYTNHQDLVSVQQSCDHLTDAIGEDHNELACGKLTSDNLVISSHQEHGTVNPSLNSNGQCHDENDMDNGKLLSVIQTNGICEEPDKLLVREQLVKENVEADSRLGSVGACNAKLTLPTEEVEVETFPIISATKETDKVATTSTDFGKLNGTLNNLETKKVVFSNDSPLLDEISSTDSPSDQVTTKGADVSEFPVTDRDSGAVTQHGEVNGMLIHNREVNLRSKALEMPNSSTIKKDSPSLIHGPMNQVASNSELTLKTAEQSRESDRIQPINASNGTTYVENHSRTSTKNSNKEPEIMAAKGNDTQIDVQSTKGGSPTLDRIKLESWKGTSKQETNPLLAFIKAFVGGFIKFWS